MVQVFLFALLFLTYGATPGYAAKKAGNVPHIELLSKATMQKLIEKGSPSEQHQILASLSGIWDYDLKYWSKKGSEPQLSNGTVDNKMVLGDRFLSSKINIILNIGGQSIPYEGWLFLGYDTIKKAYTSILIDTMHTGITEGEGQYNRKTKTLVEKGMFTHPLMDKEHTYRSEIQFTNSNTYKETVFIKDSGGKEFKVLELDFHRPH